MTNLFNDYSDESLEEMRGKIKNAVIVLLGLHEADKGEEIKTFDDTLGYVAAILTEIEEELEKRNRKDNGLFDWLGDFICKSCCPNYYIGEDDNGFLVELYLEDGDNFNVVGFENGLKVKGLKIGRKKGFTFKNNEVRFEVVYA